MKPENEMKAEYGGKKVGDLWLVFRFQVSPCICWERGKHVGEDSNHTCGRR